MRPARRTSTAPSHSSRNGPGNKRSPVALASLIEGEIIPRMLMAHRYEAEALDASLAFAPRAPIRTISQRDAEAFADIVLEQEAYALIDHIERYLESGITIESILIDLLAPAARRLGSYWDDDICDFVDVTMGLWRLQEIVHELAARMPGVGPIPGRDRRALFAVMPGDQHSFGMVMVEEFFRRAGWSTWSLPGGSMDELLQMVRKQSFELIGLTVSYEAHMDEVGDIIKDVRRASRNPGMGVMVGGRVFAERPELALACGADATAPDARQAVARAEILLEMLAFPDTSRC